MASINFYLDKTERDEAYIVMYVREKGKTIKIPTGETIPVKYWNKEKQRAKQTKAYPNYSELNLLLKNKAAKAEKALLELKGSGKEYKLSDIKAKLQIEKPQHNEKSFFQVFDMFLEWAGRKKHDRTVKKYRTLKNQLLQFQTSTNYKLSFEKINLHFYDKLEFFYLDELKSLDSTWHKYLTTFKTFMHWATDRKFNNNLEYKKFKKPKLADTDIICLSDLQLERLANLDLSSKTRLEKIRDVFCFGCYTGLRFSDISKLTKENIKGNFLQVRTYKTKDEVRVPLREEAKAIIEKYKDQPSFLPTITNQKSNLYLKELGKLAGIDEPTTIVQYRGSERVETKKPKYEFISTHTARRTFVTLSLEAGARPEIVMEITGHKSYKTFKKYIKLTENVVEKEMQRIWNKGKGDNPFMKVS